MSHPVNDEILERLYEEILNDLVCKNLSLKVLRYTNSKLEEIAMRKHKRLKELSQ